jgi:type IV pilus assembly protein PilF
VKFKSLFTYLSLIFTMFVLVSCSSSKNELTAEQSKADLFYSRGTQALVDKDYTTALDNLIKAHQLNPDDSSILNNLGMAYYLKGKPKEAMNYIQQALKKSPKNSDARNNLASIYYATGNFAEAKKEWIKVREDLVYQHQYRTYYNLALISLKEGSHREAIDYLNNSVKENSEYCAAYFKLGEISLINNAYNQALKHFQDAAKGTCHTAAAPVYQQGLVYLKLGKYDLAINKFQETRSQFPKSPEATSATVQLQQLRKENTQSRKLSAKSSAPTTNKEYSDNELEKDLNEYESPEF